MAIQQTPYVYALPGDLDWWRRAITDELMMRQITIWRKHNVIIGFGWESDDQVDTIYDDCDPHIWPTMVAHYATPAYRHLTLWSLRHQTQRNATLAAHGYRAGHAELRMHAMRPSDAPMHPIPDGFAIRSMDDALIESRVACQRNAFQSTKMTPEIYQRVRKLPSYTAAWDRVIVNDENCVVAFCTIWLDYPSRIALFEPVGCHHAYHRRGLSRALICQSLHDLSAAGMHEARVLSVSDPQAPAVHLYRRCGFQLVDELVAWRAE
ncbi:MAG: GNAT family N-acetyltransferase [Chloroflexi bacterium]|nr:GNAT family N-acetyltransferase [Chloroflexota bacterium]